MTVEGTWQLCIQGGGPADGRPPAQQIERLAAEFMRALYEAGYQTTSSTIVYGKRADLLVPTDRP